jgi:hypothetical protein
MSEPGFPAPSAGDAEQVSLALETASALWGKGDVREALRWLRRAAETAGELGDDLRAVGLARAAAELTAELQIPPSIPPPGMPRLEPPSGPYSAPAPTQPAHALTFAVRPRHALRVAVLPADNDKNVLLVRPLAEGEPLPAGAHEALLVALDPDANLLSKRR